MNREITLIDIGNTSVKIVAYSNEEIKQIQTISTKESKNENTAENIIKKYVDFTKPIYFVSVVPAVSKLLISIFLKHKLEFLELNYKKLSPDLQKKFPKDIGSDLLALCFASKPEEIALIADIGTFNKYLLISNNSIESAAIAPGYLTKYDLISKGALLEKQTPKIVENLLSKNTKDCLDSGIYCSSYFEISEFLRIIYKDNPSIKTVYLTGGCAQFFSEKLKLKLPLIYDKNLVFKGMLKLINLILGGKKWLIKN